MENVKKKLLAILGPYIVFSLVFWVFKKLFSGSINNPVTIKDLLLIGVFPLSDLWFLYALAIVYISRLVLIRVKIDERIIFLLALALSIFAMSIEWIGIIGNTAVPWICRYFSFYYGGILFQRNYEKINMKKNACLLSIAMIIAAIVSIEGEFQILLVTITTAQTA